MSEPGAEGPIRVFAPARVDLSPGFTDVEPLCAETRGLVVNVALDLGVEVTVCDEADGTPHEFFVGLLSDAVARRLAVARPVLRLSTPTVPHGSGLGVSGALSVAIAYALSVRARASLEPAVVTELACAAERDTGLTGGTQDQLASVHGGAGMVHRHQDLGRREPIPTNLAALGERLVLVHGSGSRNSGSIIDQVLARSRTSVLPIVAAMNRVAELLASSLRDADYTLLAAMMNESTALLRALHPDIVDDGVEQRLRTLGALAAKPCGAGGPGAVWAVFIEPMARADFVAAVITAGFTVVPAAPNAAGVARIRSDAVGQG